MLGITLSKFFNELRDTPKSCDLCENNYKTFFVIYSDGTTYMRYVDNLNGEEDVIKGDDPLTTSKKIVYASVETDTYMYDTENDDLTLLIKYDADVSAYRDDMEKKFGTERGKKLINRKNGIFK